MLNTFLNLDFFKNKQILITGGTGTIGNVIVDCLLSETNCKKIVIFSRDEFKQFNMKKKFSTHKNYNKLRFFIGNIRDLERLKFATTNIDIVLHAAALKQVDSIEYNPFESIKTNIIGTQNVIDSCIFSNVKLLVGISTDKSVAPVNLYGGTKLCLEKLIVLANEYNGGKLKTCVLRYGNVVGSRGSVIPLFLKQQDNGFFTVTSTKMTRFTLTKKEACTFIINCASICKGGEIFVPKLKKYTLLQICSLINPENKIKNIGIRPGEKLHEEMICEGESFKCWESEGFFIIKSNLDTDIIKQFKFIKKNDVFSYNSYNAELISEKEMLKQIESIN
jgi:UDP-N-acetylglucosamine 4,6-dehydratase/5-epimerase